MIIVGERAYIKDFNRNFDQEYSLQNDISKLVKLEKEEIKNSKILRKGDKLCNNDIYEKMQKRASILQSDKRGIQTLISLIQIKQQKAKSTEEILKQMEKYFLEHKSYKDEKKVKVKIKKKVKDSNKENSKEKEKNDDKEKNQDDVIELENIDDILSKLKEVLERIYLIEDKLNKYLDEVLEFLRTNKGNLINEEMLGDIFGFLVLEYHEDESATLSIIEE